MKIILASKSPRRQELLKMMNIDFSVVVSSKDEVIDKNLTPKEICESISLEKALDVCDKTNSDRIIISCDTIVLKDNIIYGKPKDKLDAFNMIKKLSGSSHEVISCLTVIKVINNIKTIYKESSNCLIYVSKLNDTEINDWINNHNALDKAGGYGIQEEFGKYIEKIEGDYYAVVGLPINKLYKILKEING